MLRRAWTMFLAQAEPWGYRYHRNWPHASQKAGISGCGGGGDHCPDSTFHRTAVVRLRFARAPGAPQCQRRAEQTWRV